MNFFVDVCSLSTEFKYTIVMTIVNCSNMICSIVIVNKTLQNCVKQGSVYFLLCPKRGPRIEGVELHRVCISGFFV